MAERFVVFVDCPTFNQSPYIRETMDGFCSQDTNFPFVCGIVDDASTDGEQDVIKQYLKDNFEQETSTLFNIEETDDYVRVFVRHRTNKNCFFVVVYNKYNHYSLKKSRNPHIAEWKNYSKYIAVCEGDDYWTDPLKLQKQVDLLEAYPDCTMVISNGIGYNMSSKQKKLINPLFVKRSRFVTPKEVFIEKGGLIPTASMCFRKEFMFLPDGINKAPVGDRPIRMWCAVNGRIFYFKEPMVVYRMRTPGSFSKRVEKDVASAKSILDGMNNFYDKFDNYTNRKYHKEIVYMKEREESYYYMRIGDMSRYRNCKFYKNKNSFSKRLIRKLRRIFHIN